MKTTPLLVQVELFRRCKSRRSQVSFFVNVFLNRTTTSEIDKVAKQARKRNNVIKEVADSEKQYLTNLRTLKNIYILRLTSDAKGSPPLSIEDAKIIFGNLDEIVGLSETFLSALSQKLVNWSAENTIGDVFNDHAMFFKIYVMYTNGYEYGVKKILHLFETNKEAKDIADTAQKSGVKDIASLMINPIQRIPRYVLFLKELSKCTPPDHVSLFAPSKTN